MLNQIPFQNNLEAPYDYVASGYDSTRCADDRLVEGFLKHLRPNPKGSYIDIGCGTGNYLAALSKTGLQMTGYDLSKEMLEIAGKKAPCAQVYQGAAEKMPFENEAFEGAISCLAIHHFTDLEAAAGEMFRIIKPGGRLVIFTTERSQTETFWLNEYFPKIMEQNRGLMPPISRIAHALQSANFNSIDINTWLIPEDMTDYFLYGGKHQPHVYLSPDIRNGITRFRNTERADEVSSGCIRLQEDIASGRINDIVKSHPSVCGDYTFITANK